MTNNSSEENVFGGNATNILTAALEALHNTVPDWTTMPATAIFTFLDDQLYDAREWAFKAHSPTHAKAWKERVEQYQKVLPKVKAAGELDEEPEVEDELGKTMLLVTGAALGLLAQSLDLIDSDTGEVNFDEVWNDEFLQSEQYTQMSSWGDQSFTWIVLKLRELANTLCPMVMMYESRECDPSEVSNRTLPILVLASSVLLMLAIDRLDDDAKEMLGQALADASEMHAHEQPDVNLDV